MLIISGVLKSMIVCVDSHHNSADKEEFEKPQELDRESSPTTKCFGLIPKPQKGLSK